MRSIPFLARHRELTESFRGKDILFLLAVTALFLVTGEFYREVVWENGDGFLIEVIGSGIRILLPVLFYFLIHFLTFFAVFFSLLSVSLRPDGVEPNRWDKMLVAFQLLSAVYAIGCCGLFLVFALFSEALAARDVYIDSFIPGYVLEAALWYGPVLIAVAGSFWACLNSCLFRRGTISYSFVALFTAFSVFLLLRACSVIAYAI